MPGQAACDIGHVFDSDKKAFREAPCLFENMFWFECSKSAGEEELKAALKQKEDALVRLKDQTKSAILTMKQREDTTQEANA